MSDDSMKTTAFHENRTKDHQLPGMVTLCFQSSPQGNESPRHKCGHIICSHISANYLNVDMSRYFLNLLTIVPPRICLFGNLH